MSRVDAQTLVTAAEHPVATTIEGELVLLNIETGMYQGLHGVGPHIWDLLQEPTSVESIVETLVTEYDVDAESCEADVRTFIEMLSEENLVEIDAQPDE